MTDLELPLGLVGLPDLTRFRLSGWGGEEGPFGLLESADDPELAFVVVPPAVFFPDYRPEVPEEVAATIDLEPEDEATLLVIVTVAKPVEGSTANLLGPVVVNPRSGKAAQAVLSPEHHAARTPLLATAGR